MPDRVLLIRYGEIHLKGLNRPYFENKLMSRIKKALDKPDVLSIYKGQGRFYVKISGSTEQFIDILTKIPGIISVSPAVETGKDFDRIKKECVNLLNEYKNRNSIQTFKVDARRADKGFPLQSPEIARQVGAHVLNSVANIAVDLHSPDLVLYVEVREKAYIYCEKIEGVGGLPVGANGKAILLLSGGIDSPVAGWMMAKRGVELEAVHYHSFPFTSDRAKEKVMELCRILSVNTGSIKLNVVGFTKIQKLLYEKCPREQLTILMRRSMMRIAEKIALLAKASALITGESLGQVASQTIESLNSTNIVVAMPVLRPLIGFDKCEIIERAQKIGTYETSILPYEDCCTVFTPKHPVTKPRLEKIELSEHGLELRDLMEEAVKDREIINF